MIPVKKGLIEQRSIGDFSSRTG